MHSGSSIVICYLLTALTPVIKCGESETWVPFPFKSEQQAIAVVKFPSSQRYELAKPELKDDQKVFAFDDPGGIVTYLCPTDEKQNSYTVVAESKSKAYEYHECPIAPGAAMRLTPPDDPLHGVFPNQKIHQLGYELTIKTPEEPKTLEEPVPEEPVTNTRCLNLNIFCRKKKEKPPVPEPEPEPGPLPPAPPTDPFTPLIWFVYDETEFSTRFVKYFIWSGLPLSIETEYRLEYNKLNPVDGKEINIDGVYATKWSLHNNGRYYFNSLYDNYRTYFDLGLMKRQLVPKDDLVMFTWKNATFFDVITAPMWKCLRTKWDVVEQFVRRLANVLGHLEIYAGTAGTMDARDISYYYLFKFYLYNGTGEMQVPVPAYFWKAVVNRDIGLGVLIIMHNDPFGVVTKKICSDISYEKRWLFYNNDSITGLIYSCDLTVENISKLLAGEGVQPNNLNLQGLQSELPKNIFNDILNNIYA